MSAPVARAALVIVLLALPAHAAEIDWVAVEREATHLLSAYLRIDTSNPPGNESAAARFLADQFRNEGIDVQLFESAPGRGTVLARLPGTGKGRPIVLLNHLDVVPAKAAEWQVPPFAGTIRDGFVYGRGALDCKGFATVQAMTMFLLKRQGIGLARDVIFLGTADEETGGKLGAGWFVATHADALRNAEFLLNEGGHIALRSAGRRVYEVAVSEKTPCWLRLSAKGPAGHASAPPAETAVTQLVRALGRVNGYAAPLRVDPAVQAYFATIAPLADAARAPLYRDVRATLANPKLRDAFLADPYDAALVRNTITPTVLTGSPKTNVIPQTASADLDCRLLPTQDPQAFVATMTEVVADPEVKIDVLLNFPPSSSPASGALYQAVEALATRDDAPLAPRVLRGFTDSHYFRETGIASYGFMPFELTRDDEERMHGVDERLSVANLREGTRRLLTVLQTMND